MAASNDEWLDMDEMKNPTQLPVRAFKHRSHICFFFFLLHSEWTSASAFDQDRVLGVAVFSVVGFEAYSVHSTE